MLRDWSDGPNVSGPVTGIEETYWYIYTVWLPQSGFVRLDGPEFRRYDHRYAGPDDEHSEFDIYILVSSDVGMTS